MPASSQRSSVIVCAIALTLAVLVVYWPARTFEFVNYDDHRYITRNAHVLEGLTYDNIAWAFTTFEVANWHPLTWLSHMLDVSVFGAEPQAAGRHHLMNVALHAINSALLLILLARMTTAVWRSAFVAGLFALHPLHVESVAWVAERKDLLSTLFGLLAMLAYARYVRGRDGSRDARQSRALSEYLVIVICFALSLMCKPMLVTLPALLVLLDIWPLNRVKDGSIGHALPRLIVEKLPLLALSIASALVTIVAQHHGGAIADTAGLSLLARVENAIVAYAIYLRQTIWPPDLAPFYPHPGAGGWPFATVALAGFVLVAITIACLVAFRRNHRGPLIGWLWYLGALVPVIGLVQVGGQAHADRYTYAPSIGVFIMIAWRVPTLRAQAARAALATIAIACLIALSVVTRHQAMFWRDSVVLSQRAIDVTSGNAVAHFNLGNAYIERGQIAQAREQLLIAETLAPRWADVPYNLGNLALRANDLIEAERRYQQALDLRPRFAAALNNMGLICARSGRMSQAIDLFRRAVEAAPDFADAQMNLGNALMTTGGDQNLPEALEHFQAAAILTPDDPAAHWRLGVALLRFNRAIESAEALASAIALDPINPRPRIDLADALLRQGQRELAVAHLQQAWDLARQIGDGETQSEIARKIEAIPPASPPAASTVPTAPTSGRR